jgi:putative glutamine amidotransferase
MKVDPESRMGGLLPRVLAVNSLHHQGIKELATGLRAAAWSPDGLIEAVESPDHPFRMAVQWHPENLVHANYPEFMALFKGLVDHARERKLRRLGQGAIPA